MNLKWGQHGSKGPIMDQMGSTWVKRANYGLLGVKMGQREQNIGPKWVNRDK